MPWLSTVAAGAPVIVLLGLLALGVHAHRAAIVGLLAALAVAIAGFGMPAFNPPAGDAVKWIGTANGNWNLAATVAGDTFDGGTFNAAAGAAINLDYGNYGARAADCQQPPRRARYGRPRRGIRLLPRLLPWQRRLVFKVHGRRP